MGHRGPVRRQAAGGEVSSRLRIILRGLRETGCDSGHVAVDGDAGAGRAGRLLAAANCLGDAALGPPGAATAGYLAAADPGYPTVGARAAEQRRGAGTKAHQRLLQSGALRVGSAQLGRGRLLGDAGGNARLVRRRLRGLLDCQVSLAQGSRHRRGPAAHHLCPGRWYRRVAHGVGLLSQPRCRAADPRQPDRRYPSGFATTRSGAGLQLQR